MTAAETEREMMARHMAEQEERIARQDVKIENLRIRGAPLDEALGLLTAMQDALEVIRAHVARISK